MNHQQTTSTQPTIPTIDFTPIIKSESSTAVILACAILITILLRSVTGLVEVIIKGKK